MPKRGHRHVTYFAKPSVQRNTLESLPRQGIITASTVVGRAPSINLTSARQEPRQPGAAGCRGGSGIFLLMPVQFPGGWRLSARLLCIAALFLFSQALYAEELVKERPLTAAEQGH